MEPSTSSYKIILGSSSVARRKILSEMGYQFTLMTADIDEKSIRKESPEELVMALAEAKANAIISKLQTTSNQEGVDEPTILIAADTFLTFCRGFSGYSSLHITDPASLAILRKK